MIRNIFSERYCSTYEVTCDNCDNKLFEYTTDDTYITESFKIKIVCSNCNELNDIDLD